MLKILEAPSKLKSLNKIKLFLAGGISNCPNWQNEIIEKIKSEKYPQTKNMFEHTDIFNPRRKKMSKKISRNKLKEQIIWEHNKLKESNIILFWFSKGSLNPITLFEYGKYLPTAMRLVVGIDPEYERKDDVIIQTRVIRTSQKINNSLEDLYEDLKSTIFEEIIRQNNI